MNAPCFQRSITTKPRFKTLFHFNCISTVEILSRRPAVVPLGVAVVVVDALVVVAAVGRFNAASCCCNPMKLLLVGPRSNS